MNNNNNLLRFRRLWLAIGWIMIATVFYLSLIPELPGPDSPFGDKFNHIFTFTTLMLWFSQLYRSRSQRLIVALGLMAFGIAIEFAQEQTGYRQYEVADMGADAIGIAFGFLLSETPLIRGLHWFERTFNLS